MSKGKFIVITGLDGSGTTSLGKKLANEDPIGYYLQTPHQIYSEVKYLFTDNIREQFPVAHLYFYLSAVKAASYEIKEKLKTNNVYCVRYLIDTVVSHRVAGIDIDLNYDLGYYQITKPDLTIFIDINEDVRQERISLRGKSKLDKVLDDEITREKFLKEFAKLSDHYIKINNGSSLEELYFSARKTLVEIL